MNPKFITWTFALVCMLTPSCDKPKASVERDTKSNEAPHFSLESVWRTVDSNMAFRLLPDGKADFSSGKDTRILAASYSNIDGRVRIEVNSPLENKIENLIIRDTYLEHESYGWKFYREDDYLKEWLGGQFADFSAMVIPASYEDFYVRTDLKDWFEPEKKTYGTGALEELKKLASGGLLVSEVTAKGVDSFRPNIAIYRCTLTQESMQLPRARSTRQGLEAFIWGKYEILTTSTTDTANNQSMGPIVTGTYKFHPNSLGIKALKMNNEELREKYKFKALISPARTIANQPLLSAWDWGYINEEGYKTSNIK